VALTGAPNHAKIGVSTGGAHDYAIFGDLNQQGQLGAPPGGKANCASSQNGRGGMFLVLEDATLTKSLRAFIAGDTAPGPGISALP
jgi:hypothetical protein